MQLYVVESIAIIQLKDQQHTVCSFDNACTCTCVLTSCCGTSLDTRPMKISNDEIIIVHHVLKVCIFDYILVIAYFRLQR